MLIAITTALVVTTALRTITAALGAINAAVVQLPSQLLQSPQHLMQSPRWPYRWRRRAKAVSGRHAATVNGFARQQMAEYTSFTGPIGCPGLNPKP